jgi:prepilin-type N-terminal cleavage/methylation domain-containing protein
MKQNRDLLRRHSLQGGFTIIELMVATMVFSIVLLIASNSVVQIGRMYYKGLISSQTQDAARSVLEDVSRTLQLSKGNLLIQTPAPPAFSTKVICIGNSRYTYIIDHQLNPAGPSGPGDPVSKHVLWLDTMPVGGCVPVDLSQDTPSAGGKELLATNMRMLEFSVDKNTFQISIRLAYGPSDLLSSYDNDSHPVNLTGPAGTIDEADSAQALCKSGVAGSNFCAVSALDTMVQRRIN